MGSINDPTIKIKPSKKLENFIVECLGECSDVSEGIKQIQLGEYSDSEILLSISDIKWLYQYLQHGGVKKDGTVVYIHELLEGSEIKLPELEVIPRNPELEARIQKLKVEQAEREYKAMTKAVDGVRVRLPEDSIGYQLKQINRQLIAVLQFVFSVVAAFVFGFLGIQLIVGELDFGFRLLLGVICGLIVALAEIYFLAKKLSEEDICEPDLTYGKLHQE